MASINRGCAAISEGGYGGARTEVTDDGITRAPCIAMPDIHQAFKLKQVEICVAEDVVSILCVCRSRKATLLNRGQVVTGTEELEQPV